jgi:hypothetical protein
LAVSYILFIYLTFFCNPQRLKRKEGRRPAVLLGLRDNENDSGVIRVYARRLQVSNPSLTIPVSSTITTEQVIKEALARFRLEDEDLATYQLVKVTLEAGRG